MSDSQCGKDMRYHARRTAHYGSCTSAQKKMLLVLRLASSRCASATGGYPTAERRLHMVGTRLSCPSGIQRLRSLACQPETLDPSRKRENGTSCSPGKSGDQRTCLMMDSAFDALCTLQPLYICSPRLLSPTTTSSPAHKKDTFADMTHAPPGDQSRIGRELERWAVSAPPKRDFMNMRFS